MNGKYRNPSATERYRGFLASPEKIPFFFKLDGVDFNLGKLGAFEKKPADGRRGGESTVFTWHRGSLKVELLLTHYIEFGATEWTVWFENDGKENTPRISDVKTVLEFSGEHPELKGILGDHVNQYRPYCSDLSASPVHFYSSSGRATHINFPYFNLEHGNSGTMLAIGWAGSWTADFSYSEGKTTYVARSNPILDSYLKPSERIRTGLFVSAPYTVRNENFATNYWRRWFVGCNLPEDSMGAALKPFSTACLCDDTGLPNSDGSISERHFTWKRSLDKMIEENCKTDFRWFDAGWYQAPDLSSPESDWWGTVGTWELDPEKWPGKSFRESTDYARKNGMRTLMWFEPERVTDVPDLVKNFGYKKEWAISFPGYYAISNNIGDPDCFNWTLGRITKVICENKVEMYREDNNCDAAMLWKYMDSLEGEGRMGITEEKLIDAHYRLWDKIIECTLSVGGCGFVDSCASGGGRNDLESMRRGVPLLRSDADRTSTALRLSMSWGFLKWIPFCGACIGERTAELGNNGFNDAYSFRASYLPILNASRQFYTTPDDDFSVHREGLSEWSEVKPYLLKDFYTLTPWHSMIDRSYFTAFLYYDETDEKTETANRGVITAFRMEECDESSFTLVLPISGEFILTDKDTGEKMTVRGGECVTLHFPDRRTSKLIFVERK